MACCRSSRSPLTAAGSPPSTWSATRTSSLACGNRADRPGPGTDVTGLAAGGRTEFARRPGSAKVLERTSVSAGDAWPALHLGGRADVAQLVEHHLAKVRVAGSNPVVRSEAPDAVYAAGGPHGSRDPFPSRRRGRKRRSGRVA